MINITVITTMMKMMKMMMTTQMLIASKVIITKTRPLLTWRMSLLLIIAHMTRSLAEEYDFSGNYNNYNTHSKCHIITIYSLKTAECMMKNFTSVPKNLDTDIKSLNLHKNQISVIRDYSFRDYSSLQNIYLANNRILNITQDAFLGMDNLQILDLESNFLASVPGLAFKHLKSLRILTVNNNPITRLGKHDFKYLATIETLKFENCQIAMIEPQAFKALGRLYELNLANNQLKNLHFMVRKSFRRLTVLRLYNNQWRCDCHLRWLRISLQSIPNWDFGANSPICESPNILRGVSWKHLSPDKFACASIIQLPGDIRMVGEGNPINNVGGNFASDDGRKGRGFSQATYNNVLSDENYNNVNSKSTSKYANNLNATSIEVTLGSNTSLKCIAWGDPGPTITWIRGGLMIPQQIITQRIVPQPYPNLKHHPNLNDNDDFTGYLGFVEYQNQFGEGEYLNKDKNKDKEGDEINDDELSSETGSSVESMLHITFARRSDAGSYKCVAENSAGRSEIIYHVWVNDKKPADNISLSENLVKKFSKIFSNLEVILGIIFGCLLVVGCLVTCLACVVSKKQNKNAKRKKANKKHQKLLNNEAVKCKNFAEGDVDDCRCCNRNVEIVEKSCYNEEHEKLREKGEKSLRKNKPRHSFFKSSKRPTSFSAIKCSSDILSSQNSLLRNAEVDRNEAAINISFNGNTLQQHQQKQNKTKTSIVHTQICQNPVCNKPVMKKLIPTTAITSSNPATTKLNSKTTKTPLKTILKTPSSSFEKSRNSHTDIPLHASVIYNKNNRPPDIYATIPARTPGQNVKNINIQNYHTTLNSMPENNINNNNVNINNNNIINNNINNNNNININNNKCTVDNNNVGSPIVTYNKDSVKIYSSNNINIINSPIYNTTLPRNSINYDNSSNINNNSNNAEKINSHLSVASELINSSPPIFSTLDQRCNKFNVACSSPQQKFNRPATSQQLAQHNNNNNNHINVQSQQQQQQQQQHSEQHFQQQSRTTTLKHHTSTIDIRDVISTTPSPPPIVITSSTADNAFRNPYRSGNLSKRTEVSSSTSLNEILSPPFKRSPFSHQKVPTERSPRVGSRSGAGDCDVDKDRQMMLLNDKSDYGTAV